MLLRNPVITGTGIVSAVGCGMDSVWAALRAGEEGLGFLTLFDSPRYSKHLVGEVRLDVAATAGRRGSRADQLAWIAAREALAEAGLAPGKAGLAPERVAVALGCTVGGMLGTERFLIRLLRDQRHRFGPLRFHECSTAAEMCAALLGAAGPCVTFSTACSAAAMAVAAGAEWIESGEADLVLAGGSDSLSRLTLNGFGSLLLLDPAGCRPFDAGRAGISLGEGAALLVMEAEESARARGAAILARLSGWGASCDAWHATAPHPEGHGARQAVQRALDRAGLAPPDIGYVNAHGTGTPDNDAMEAKALREVFGDPLPPVSSVKRFFGHTLAASGAIEAVLCIRALREQGVPPNPGFCDADPGLGLVPVRQFQSVKLQHVLSNSFGFGGNNVALVFSREELPMLRAHKSKRHDRNPEVPDPGRIPTVAESTFAVLGLGVVSPAGSSLSEIQAAFAGGGVEPVPVPVPAATPPGQVSVLACGSFGAESRIPAGQRRKLSRLQQMVLVAASQSAPEDVLPGMPSERLGVAVGTGLGSLNDTARFLENMILQEERAPRPLFFSNSVHNSLASQVAMERKATGLNLTPVQRETCFEAALWHGARELVLGRADLVFAGAADELNAYHLAAGMRWGWWSDSAEPMHPFQGGGAQRCRPWPGEGCAMVTLARENDLDQVGRGNVPEVLARVSAIRLGRAAGAAEGRIDAEAEAGWIEQSLTRAGEALAAVDLLLTGANGWPRLDGMYAAVAAALSRRAGRRIPCGAYKHCCGEHHAASAFGMVTAIALVRGAITTLPCLGSGGLDRPCRKVLLLTLSAAGTKGMCCVGA